MRIRFFVLIVSCVLGSMPFSPKAQAQTDTLRVRVVEKSDREDLYLVDADGTPGQNLTHLPEDSDVYHVSFSRDCRKIVFVWEQWSDETISVVDAKGSEVRSAATCNEEIGGCEEISSPVFSPDGNRILFVRSTDTSTAIWSMGTDGSDQRPLIDMSGEEWGVWYSGNPWSPNGTKLLFAGQRGNNFVRDLFHADPDGSNVKRLTETPESTDFFAPRLARQSWSPDGTKILYESGGDTGKREVWIMDADGSNQRQLTRTPMEDVYASPVAWSPDGNRIVFHRIFRVLSFDDYYEDIYVYVMNADGSSVRRLTGSIKHSPKTAQTTGAVRWSAEGIEMQSGRRLWVLEPDPGHPYTRRPKPDRRPGDVLCPM